MTFDTLLNILVQLPFLAVFIWFFERTNSRSSAELDKLTGQFQAFLREEREERKIYMTNMLNQIKALQDDFETHDRMMSEAIARMEERTKPLPPRGQSK